MIQLLKSELEYFQNVQEKSSRKTFDLNQITSIEAEIIKSEKLTEIFKKLAAAEVAKIKAQKRLNYVLDEIEAHAEGSGVTIFMPHVLTRDLYKRVQEIGEGLHLTARERTNAIVTAEHLNIINCDGVNMPQVLFDHINGKEVLMVCWKIPDDQEESIECN